MKLGDIRAYLKARKLVALHDIVNHFDISEASAQWALDFLQQQAKIEQVHPACGSSCGGCGTKSGLYRWIECQSLKVRLQ